MADPVTRIYWDADVLVSYIEENPDRAPVIEGLLAQARASEIEIVTYAKSPSPRPAFAGDRIREPACLALGANSAGMTARCVYQFHHAPRREHRAAEDALRSETVEYERAA